MISILRASGRNARIARSSPIRCGPRMRNGSEYVPDKKLFSSSGGIPATEKGFVISIQPRGRPWVFNGFYRPVGLSTKSEIRISKQYRIMNVRNGGGFLL